MSHGHDHNASHDHGHAPGAAGADIYPAGAAWAKKHHSHVVVSQRILVTVLGLLMFFTLLTVGAAQGEQWFSHTFDVVIPQWVNVAVALSIAVIKSVIVAAFFMQLKYDNPINSTIAVFTIFVLAFFFGFIMIDLGNRGALYDYKSREITAGGTGAVLGLSTSIPENARLNAAKNLEQMIRDGKTPPEFLCHFASEEADRLTAAKKEIPAFITKAIEIGHNAYPDAGGHGGHGGAGHDSTASSAARSRIKTGITLAELGATTGHDSHGAAEHGKDEHKGENKDGHAPAGDAKEPAHGK